MTYNNIVINPSGDALIVTINRPKVMNALNLATMDELAHFFSHGYKEYDDFPGVILTGSGDKAFVAGADISEFSHLDAEAGRAFAQRGQDVFFLIERFHRVVIAAVNGYALGGGCELAMSCHLRIASPQARFGQPEVNLALIPGYGGTQRLVQYIGKTRAMDLLMTGRMIDAQTALSWALVNRVSESNDVVADAKDMLKAIASKGPLAIERIIGCVNAFFETETNGFDVESQRFGETIASEDSTEGARAFLEKRKAVFQGR